MRTVFVVAVFFLLSRRFLSVLGRQLRMFNSRAHYDESRGYPAHAQRLRMLRLGLLRVPRHGLGYRHFETLRTRTSVASILHTRD